MQLDLRIHLDRASRATYNSTLFKSFTFPPLPQSTADVLRHLFNNRAALSPEIEIQYQKQLEARIEKQGFDRAIAIHRADFFRSDCSSSHSTRSSRRKSSSTNLTVNKAKMQYMLHPKMKAQAAKNQNEGKLQHPDSNEISSSASLTSTRINGEKDVIDVKSVFDDACIRYVVFVCVFSKSLLFLLLFFAWQLLFKSLLTKFTITNTNIIYTLPLLCYHKSYIMI